MYSYIYLIQTGEHINSQIFKVGRTTQNGDTRFLNRFHGYSKNSVQKFLREVLTVNVISIEKEIKNLFKNKYTLKKGSEWFCGDCQNMIADINTIISKYSGSNLLTNQSTINPITTNINKPISLIENQLVYINAKNNELLKIANIRYWLIDTCKKWIIYEGENEIHIILLTKTMNRLDSIYRSFKSRAFMNSEKSVFSLKSKKDIFTTKSIKKNEDLKDILKKYFFSSTNNINMTKSFINIELKGYTKKFIKDLIENNISYDNININDSNEDNNKKINSNCEFCNKEFSRNYNKYRHEKICKENINKESVEDTNNESKLLENKKSKKKNGKDIKFKEMKTDLINSLSDALSKKIKDSMGTAFKDSLESMFQKMFVNNKSSVKINSNNVQINNYQSKKDKLNKALKDIVDLDTFIEKYENDPKYQLTKEETENLLNTADNLIISYYGEELLSYIKQKYSLLLKEFNPNKTYDEKVLPFFCKDVNLRTHYELTNKGWIMISYTENIKKIIEITNSQIFKHHHKFIPYSKKRGYTPVINSLLRNSDFTSIVPILDKLIEEVDNNQISSLNDTDTKSS